MEDSQDSTEVKPLSFPLSCPAEAVPIAILTECLHINALLSAIFAVQLDLLTRSSSTQEMADADHKFYTDKLNHFIEQAVNDLQRSLKSVGSS